MKVRSRDQARAALQAGGAAFVEEGASLVVGPKDARGVMIEFRPA